MSDVAPENKKSTESRMDNNGDDKQGSTRYTTEATKLRDKKGSAADEQLIVNNNYCNNLEQLSLIGCFGGTRGEGQRSTADDASMRHKPPTTQIAKASFIISPSK